MSNFLNKIPVSPITSFGNPSVPNGSTIGTNFSILQTGGFMEVYTLSGLTYTIPPATTGIIEFSGNSIPIQFTKGSGSAFSPDVLTLNSDNISSGRRKLGMLVYVYETNKIYQFRIDNYDTLWNNATGATTGPGGPTVVISDFGTTVKNNTLEGQAFINAWTASTISGIGGYNDTNASWRVLSTGGNSGGGTSITGGTFDNNTDTLTLNNSTGGTITITGFTDYYTTGFTFNPASYDLTIKRNDGLPDLSVNLSILSSDVTITGGTYNSSTGTATFTNNTGGTFNVTGFLTGFTDIYVTGGTFNSNNQTLTLTRNDNANINVSGFTDVFVTGGTKTGNNVVFTNNTGGTFTITGFTDTFVTGATYSNNTFTYINNTGGTFSVLFNTMTGLTATTISATTYQNLPTDIRVTGGTYSASTGITTFRNNTGGTFTVTGYFTPTNDIYVSGGTIGNGPDTSNNKITLNRSDGNNVTLNTLVDIVNLTKSDMDTIISIGKVIRGKTYKISGCDNSLYYNGTDRSEADVYTTIYLMGLEDDKLSESGIGVFYTPKYDIYEIFVDEKPFPNGTYVIWGGFVWLNKGGDEPTNSIDIFTLPEQYEKIFPFDDSDDYNKDYYNEQYDDIIYDYTSDRIIYRNEQNSNIVSTTYENITYWVTKVGYYNPIRVFQWGHLVNFSGGSVIYNQQIINSYNENINYLGISQGNFYFNNLSYQKDLFVDYNSYQNNFIFDNQSYQNDITISGSSGQNDIFLNNRSYQDRIILNDFSFQNQITLNNYSYQNRIDILGFGTDSAIQNYFNFNNGSYQNEIILQSGNGKPAIQSYFNFNNNSYQNNIDLIERQQNKLDFTNNSGQSNIENTSQNSLIFDSSTQINRTSSLTQTNITIKNYDRDLTSVTNPEQDRYFIHDLPTDNTASVYIGKINNQLVQVTKPIDVFVTGGTYNSGTGIITFRNNSGTSFNVTGITTSSTFTGGTVSGATIFTNGLTANTISATTYQNLPIDIRVTGGTYTSGNAIFTNNTGGTFTVTGFAVGSGGGQLFYLNLSQSEGSNRLLSTTASTTSQQTSGVTINSGVTGTIASFQSPQLNTILIPGGIWSFHLHSYKEDSNASFDIFVEVYKRTSGGTQTLLFQTEPTTVLTNSPLPSMQITESYFSGTSLVVSDSIVTIVRATNTGNQTKIITLVTEGTTYYSYVVSSLPTQQGLTCDTLSGCSIIQTIQTDVSNKLDKSGGTITGDLIINSGLTANTISATTYQNLPATPFLPLSGGTVSGNTIFTSGLTGDTIVVNVFNYTWTGPVVGSIFSYFNDTIYSNETGKTHYFGGGPANAQNNLSVPNGSLQVGGNVLISSGLTANTISATTYQNLPTDIRVTGGTYSGSTIIFTNNTGGTFNVTGLYTGGTDVFVTGATKSGNVATFTNNTGGTFTLTGLTDTFVTGGTYDTGSSSITFTNNSGGTFSVTGITSSGGGSFTGGTVSGPTTFTNGLTANTISATTITSPSISSYGLIVATSIGYQNIF